MNEYIDCDECGNDGWVDVIDETGKAVGADPCPHSGNLDHPPFDYRSLLDPDAKL